MKPASKNLQLGLFGQCSTHWKVLAAHASSCAFCVLSPFEIEKKIHSFKPFEGMKKMQNKPVNHDGVVS